MTCISVFIWRQLVFLLVTHFDRKGILKSQAADKLTYKAVALHSSFFFVGRQPLLGHGLLFVAVSRPHSNTPHSEGLLWTGDQPVAETST